MATTGAASTSARVRRKRRVVESSESDAAGDAEVEHKGVAVTAGKERQLALSSRARIAQTTAGRWRQEQYVFRAAAPDTSHSALMLAPLAQGGNTRFLSCALQILFHTKSWARFLDFAQCKCHHVQCISCMLRDTYTRISNQTSAVPLCDWSFLLEHLDLEPGSQFDVCEFSSRLYQRWTLAANMTEECSDDGRLFMQCFSICTKTYIRYNALCSNADCQRARHTAVLACSTSGSCNIKVHPRRHAEQRCLQSLLDAEHRVERLDKFSCQCELPAENARKHDVHVVDANVHTIGLHICRYCPNAQKIASRVTLPPVILCSGRAWTLRSWGAHLGASGESGHYIAWVRRRQQILEYNDGILTVYPHDADLPTWSSSTTHACYDEVDAFKAVVLTPHLRTIIASFCDAPTAAAALAMAAGAPPGTQATQQAAAPACDAALAPHPGIHNPEDTAEKSEPTFEPVYLPENFAQANMKRDVARLLEEWTADNTGTRAKEFLKTLPLYVDENHEPPGRLELIEDRFDQALRHLVRNTINCRAALTCLVYLGDTMPYPFAVLFEACAVSTSCPAVFVADTVYGLANSLFHRESCIRFGRWKTRSRYWMVGTANKGEGKSPATEPILKAFVAAMLKYPAKCPGAASDRFHLDTSVTQAAGEDKLRFTRGYFVAHSDEAGSVLCDKAATT